MTSQENLPKIVKDITDVISQLSNDFNLSNDPVTDDNHALHRLCAKLEFLLSSHTKDKSVLGNKKTYWHWIYTCLKNTKGLSDGLRYVQTNKEVRTSKGRGRAFVRYCLVHQTLADSLQNCIMNRNATRQYYTSDSILLNPAYSSAFVTALYDLNAVNFDLNSKGYDLDAGWPTFASKRNNYPQDIDHWAIRSHVGSLASFPSASVVMDAPRMHGSGSSGPHSVDHRVEELVLELDQSDQKIKEQQQIILDLESKAESLLKSSNEKEDILARVISDLESKNRHLHVAMSDMSSEFQAREQQWSEKHDNLSKNLSRNETKNKTLQLKIEQLEQDKRTLEELVSQKMSSITSSFVSTTENSILTPVTSLVMQEHDNSEIAIIEELQTKIDHLKEELHKSREQDLRTRLNMSDNSEISNLDEMVSHVEEKQTKIEDLQRKLASLEVDHQLFVNNVKEALSLEDNVECSSIVLELLKLREQCKIKRENLERKADAENTSLQTASLKEENEFLKFDRDIAQMDVDTLKHKLKATKLEIDQLAVQLESSRNDSVNRIRELEENLSICQQQLENQQRHHREMLEDLKLTQDALQQSEKELEAAQEHCQDLELKESSISEELNRTKQALEDELSENEIAIEQLQEDLKHHSSLSNNLTLQLDAEKLKSNRLSADLFASKKISDSFSKQLIDASDNLKTSEQSASRLRLEIERLATVEKSHEEVAAFYTSLLEAFLEKFRLIDKFRDIKNLKLNEFNENDLPGIVSHCINKLRSFQGNLNEILLEHRKTKGELINLQSKYSKETEERKSSKEKTNANIIKLQEQLSDIQSKNDIHLVTIKDLNDRQQAMQVTEAAHLTIIKNLEFKIEDLTKSLEASKKDADELRLRVMSESTKCVEAGEKIKRQNEDIESLKDKITQLLVDKDNLWKESETLRERLHNQNDDVTSASFSISKEYDDISVVESVNQNDEVSNENKQTSNVNLKDEETLIVSARREYHVPIYVEHSGVTLYWEISSDRDIKFKICYSETEEGSMIDILESRKIDSHLQTFVGDLVARQAGIYTLVLDNTYSRFTSKTITYKLGVVSVQSEFSS